MPVPILFSVRELGVGGCERDVTKLALAIDRVKFTPHVAYFHDGFRSPELRAAGVPLVHLPVKSFLDRSAWEGVRVFSEYVRAHEIQISHAYDVPLSIFTSVAGRRAGVPVVIASMLGYRDLFPAKERYLLPFSDRLAHRIVVNSEAVRRHLMADYRVPERKLFLSRNGYSPEVFFAPAPGGRPRPGALAGAGLVIGTISALRKEKNPALLVEAFARIRRPGLRLLILGSGVLEAGLKEQAARLGIADDCVFEPGRADVAPWYRSIDIFVHSSVSESFPNGVLEAMASGCATVATRVGGVPELVRHEETGLLFESGDVAGLTAYLERLTSDAALRERLGRSAAAAALREFTMAHYCERMERFYGVCLGLPASAGVER